MLVSRRSPSEPGIFSPIGAVPDAGKADFSGIRRSYVFCSRSSSLTPCINAATMASHSDREERHSELLSEALKRDLRGLRDRWDIPGVSLSVVARVGGSWASETFCMGIASPDGTPVDENVSEIVPECLLLTEYRPASRSPVIRSCSLRSRSDCSSTVEPDWQTGRPSTGQPRSGAFCHIGSSRTPYPRRKRISLT